MKTYSAIVFAMAILSPVESTVFAQDVKDVSKPINESVKNALSEASFDQPLMTHREYTGKNLGVETGWILKARGTAKVSKINDVSGKVFRIDYAEVKLPDGTIKKAYSDYEGNLAISVEWTSETRGEKWGVVGSAKTFIEAIWGKSHPAGKANLSVKISKAGAKVSIEIKDLNVQAGKDTRPSEFVVQRIITPKLPALVQQALKVSGIEPVKS